MPQDVEISVAPPYLEITVVTARPAIDHFHHLDATVADQEYTRHLFATVARGTLHTNDHSRIRFHTERADGLSW
jgi:hypothetical protein